MAERSRNGSELADSKAEVLAPPVRGLGRGWLATGLVLVALIAAGIAWGLGALRGEPDPGRLFYAGEDGIYEHDLESGEDERVATFPSLELASVSPDARWVAYLSDGRLVVADLEEEEDLSLEVADRLVVPLGWSPDVRLVAGELLSDGDLVAVDPLGSREILLSGYARGATPVWLDDHRFAVSRTSKDFVIIENREAVASTQGVPLAASADGAELLLQRDDEVVVAKIDGNSVSNPRTVFRGRASRAATSRSGLVAITGKDEDGREGVWVFEGGSDVRRVVDEQASWLGWSAESSHLLYARDGAVYGMRVPDGKAQRLSRKDVEVFPLFSFTVVP